MFLKNLLKKSNYAPWTIDPSNFPTQASFKEKILFLLGFVVLAPSGHNTQPWLFEVSDNYVTFLFSSDRSLHDSDPEGRQLLIAFGCALENFSIAAKHFGFELKIKFLSFPNSKDNKICTIEFINTIPIPQDLIFAITKRHTNRGPYINKEISVNFTQSLQKLSTDSFNVMYINDEEQKNKISELAINAQIVSMGKKSFRNELSGFVKSNFTKSYTGMPGFALGIPSIVSFFVSPLIKRVNLSKMSEKKDRKIIKQTPGYIVVTSRNDNPISWIETGQIFERAWLTATAYGMAFSPLAAVVQEQTYRKEFEHVLGTNFHVVAFARVGIPIDFSFPSPRFPVDYLLIK